MKEECAVLGVYGSEEAAQLAYLGLYALQHRGQESSGIITSDGEQVHEHRGMGLVSKVFDEKTLARLGSNCSCSGRETFNISDNGLAVGLYGSSNAEDSQVPGIETTTTSEQSAGCDWGSCGGGNGDGIRSGNRPARRYHNARMISPRITTAAISLGSNRLLRFAIYRCLSRTCS